MGIRYGYIGVTFRNRAPPNVRLQFRRASRRKLQGVVLRFPFPQSPNSFATRGAIRDRLNDDVVDNAWNQEHEEKDDSEENLTRALKSSDLPDAMSAAMRAFPTLRRCGLDWLFYTTIEKFTAVLALDSTRKDLLTAIRANFQFLIAHFIFSSFA
jgi:hypothetical protein